MPMTNVTPPRHGLTCRTPKEEPQIIEVTASEMVASSMSVYNMLFACRHVLGPHTSATCWRSLLTMSRSSCNALPRCQGPAAGLLSSGSALVEGAALWPAEPRPACAAAAKLWLASRSRAAEATAA